jgi:hypothetical protein
MARRPPRPAPVAGVSLDPLPPREVARELRALLAAGAELRPAGLARSRPRTLLAPRYRAKRRAELFGVRFYLADPLYEPGLNFLLAHVVTPRARRVHPRIFYKDASLAWRVASHMIRNASTDWIGKGDVRWVSEGDLEVEESDEDSANLPYELHPALDQASRAAEARDDGRATALVLRNAPEGRVEPYADFSAPRRRAERRQAIHGNRPIARIARLGDPHSLVFARGFEPDFGRPPLEVQRIASRLYGGSVRKFRVLSRNGLVQYQFAAAPRHAWVNPPQALTRELTSYGVRALHVRADDAIFIPGFEYHFEDETTGELQSQIPPGFAGRQSSVDPTRADASAWIEELPVIREFRRRILGRGRRARRWGAGSISSTRRREVECSADA